LDTSKPRQWATPEFEATCVDSLAIYGRKGLKKEVTLLAG